MDEWEAEAVPDFHNANSQLQASGVDLKTHASPEPPHVASKQEAMAVGLRRDLAELTGTLAMNVPLLGSLFAGGSARVLHAQTTSPGPALAGGLETEPSVDDEQDSETEEAGEVLDAQGSEHGTWPVASDQFRQVLSSARHDVIDFQQQVAGEISRFAISVLGMSAEDDVSDVSDTEEEDFDCEAEANGQESVEDLGVNEEVLMRAAKLASDPKTWLDFPAVSDSEVVFEMSAEQEAHRVVVLMEVPALQHVMEQLCPSQISQSNFWMIYFARMHSQLGHKVKGAQEAVLSSSISRNTSVCDEDASVLESRDQMDDPDQPASLPAALNITPELAKDLEGFAQIECAENAGEESTVSASDCKGDPASDADADWTDNHIPVKDTIANQQEMQTSAYDADGVETLFNTSCLSVQDSCTPPLSSSMVSQARSELAEDPAEVSLWKDCTAQEHDDKHDQELAQTYELDAEVNAWVEHVDLEANGSVADDASDHMEQLPLTDGASSGEENDFVEVFSPSKSMNRENSIGWLVVDGDDEC
mmetsp:Transcript_89/g.159  ORF Transcript_89/g.159 Transcript_89/m.159 type:complete len:533 (-) Transcript_89:332-1930(-)|eukprot:CAMPEP_0114246310 /NCGR_PEP_ID=MMETSP0058-20121206/12388_1 /TAXON_ID=36894 /ORGANISM="Pyramimonas parkeae, CCMP726" /LENGTH=532 /DNA_ID=CAMNT_0001359475 /DNA_START=553 /DNA_END=2151 /DNA_ORIENTATION=-